MALRKKLISVALLWLARKSIKSYFGLPGYKQSYSEDHSVLPDINRQKTRSSQNNHTKLRHYLK